MSCDPEQFSKGFLEIFNQAIEEAEKGDINLTTEELNHKKDCLFSYLREYEAFATADRATDKQIDDLYQKTLKLFKGALEARDYQRRTVEDHIRTLEDMLFESIDPLQHEALQEVLDSKDFEPVELSINKELLNERYNIEKYRGAKEILKTFAKDKRELRRMKKEKCDNKTERFDKFMCIESFAHAVHTRGPYLSTACGFPMPEQILEYIKDTTELDDLGLPAADMTKKTLDCLFGKDKAFNPDTDLYLKEASLKYGDLK